MSCDLTPLPNDSDSTALLLRMPAVQRATGLSRASIYRAVAAGKFPKPRKLGERAIAFSWGDVRAWLASRSPTLPTGNA